MGCDIHLYIEYKNKESENWRDFGGRINPGRHYGFFAKLCGVRNYWEDEIIPISAPKGMPVDSAYESRSDNQIYVVESTDHDSESCSRETADRWVECGLSKYTDERRNFVTNPDWHSHSWANADELESVIKDETLQSFDGPEYVAVLGALRSFEWQGYDARIVFWFDN
jgi:hypothetical protein